MEANGQEEHDNASGTEATGRSHFIEEVGKARSVHEAREKVSGDGISPGEARLR